MDFKKDTHKLINHFAAKLYHATEDLSTIYAGIHASDQKDEIVIYVEDIIRVGALLKIEYSEKNPVQLTLMIAEDLDIDKYNVIEYDLKEPNSIALLNEEVDKFIEQLATEEVPWQQDTRMLDID